MIDDETVARVVFSCWRLAVGDGRMRSMRETINQRLQSVYNTAAGGLQLESQSAGVGQTVRCARPAVETY